MIDLDELERIILGFNKKEVSTVELMEYLLGLGFEINRNFYKNIDRLEKFEIISIDRERKPWVIKKG